MAKRKHLKHRKHHSSSTAPRRHKIRRRRAHHRRSNPTTVLLANPRRRRHLRRATHHTRHRRSNPTFTRRRRRRRSISHVMRHHRVHRRSNPFRTNIMNVGGLLGTIAFGGLGVIIARVVGTLYSRHVANTVIGTESDPKGWRHILNEVLRLAAMAAATVVVERVLAKVKILSPQYRQAVLIGGLGETGRQAIGVVVNRLSPTTDRSTYGLDGPPSGYVDASGTTWILRGGRYYPLVAGAGAMSGLEDGDDFSGLDDADAFGAVPFTRAYATN